MVKLKDNTLRIVAALLIGGLVLITVMLASSPTEVLASRAQDSNMSRVENSVNGAGLENGVAGSINFQVVTVLPTTAAPTTAAPTTAAPTTAAPTTAAPTTAAPTTAAPTTAAPTTAAPTTAAPTTTVPTTAAPTTTAPTTSAPATSAPTTSAPTTSAPATSAPTTAVVTTPVATTAAPTTVVETTAASTTPASTTPANPEAVLDVVKTPAPVQATGRQVPSTPQAAVLQKAQIPAGLPQTGQGKSSDDEVIARMLLMGGLLLSIVASGLVLGLLRRKIKN